jgi:hypothetical protein
MTILYIYIILYFILHSTQRECITWKSYWGRCEISVEGRMTVRKRKRLSLITKYLHFMWQCCSFANILYYFQSISLMDFLTAAESSRNSIHELLGSHPQVTQLWARDLTVVMTTGYCLNTEMYAIVFGRYIAWGRKVMISSRKISILITINTCWLWGPNCRTAQCIIMVP